MGPGAAKVLRSIQQWPKDAPAKDETADLRARLLAAFDLSDRRGNELLVAIAEIHAKRYPKVPS